MKKPKRVVVLAQASEGQYRRIEAEVGLDRATILNAELLENPPESADRPGGAGGAAAPNHVERVLVIHSDKAICRVLDLPPASADQTRRMAAVRLETELPYPVEDSTWVCERLMFGEENAGREVLVTAVPSSEIHEAEERLIPSAKRADTVLFEGAVLAQLAPTDDSSEAPLAVMGAGKDHNTLVIVHQGRMHYARRLFSESGGAEDAKKLANEIDQCLDHYALQSKTDKPDRLVLVGLDADIATLRTLLGDHLGTTVELASLPECIQIAKPEEIQADLMRDFPLCVGAVLACHRKVRGETLVAQPLRAKHRRFLDKVSRKVALFAGIAVLLIAGLAASQFGYRRAQVKTLDRVVKKARPLAVGFPQLEAEVNILKDEARRHRPLIDTLQALAECLPEEIQVSSLVIDSKGKVSISGLSPTVETAEMKAIAALQESKAFKNPKFLNATREKDKYKFRITCELAAPSGGKTP